MREEISLINTDSKMPLEVSIVKFDTLFRHMHAKPQVILVLDGECDIYINETCYHMANNDMVVINKRTFHHLVSNHYCSVITVNLDLKGFGLEDNEIDAISFNLNTMEIKDNPRYNQIRYLIYSIIKYNTMENFNSIYTNRAISFSFFAQLMNDFGVTNAIDHNKNEGLSTITKIEAYINDHYKEKITLTQICNEFNYTTSYLSRLFKITTGHSFIYFYDSLRVNYSLNDLLLTNKTIEEISLEHGFENARSYVRAFNSIHHMNPSEYRKSFSKKQSKELKIDRKLFKKNALDKILSQYDKFGHIIDEPKKDSVRKSEIVSNINFKGPHTKLNTLGSSIFELSGAGDLFGEDSYHLLKEAKHELNYEYIMVPNILAHKTYILTKNDHKQWVINYNYFDKMLQKIYSLGAKPYLIFEYEANLLEPNVYFTLLLQIESYLNEHYKNETKEMMIAFSMIHDNKEANSYLFKKEIFAYYINLFTDLKRKFPGIKIGAPVFYRRDIEQSSDYFRFLNYMKEYNFTFDFIPLKYSEMNNDGSLLTKDKSELKHFLKDLDAKGGLIPNKIYLQSINFTNYYNLLNDTLYASSYMIKNYIDTCDIVGGYSKYCFQDKVMFSAYDPNPFHGEAGLFTYNGIKKSSYTALIFLSKLQRNILNKDKYSIVTASDHKIVILINNYNHYSDLYALKEYYEISNLNRYVCFPSSAKINFRYEINNLDFKSSNIKIYSLSKESGSSYDKWLTMGAKKDLTEDEITCLKNVSALSFEYREEIITDNHLSLDFTINPLESKLIEIELND